MSNLDQFETFPDAIEFSLVTKSQIIQDGMQRGLKPSAIARALSSFSASDEKTIVLNDGCQEVIQYFDPLIKDQVYELARANSN